jgi:hypothetical protein
METPTSVSPYLSKGLPSPCVRGLKGGGLNYYPKYSYHESIVKVLQIIFVMDKFLSFIWPFKFLALFERF